MEPRRYGPFPYTPITRRPKIQWPNGARGGEQVLARLERRPGVLAAGAGMILEDLVHRPVAAFVDQVVEIDREQRRPLADIRFPMVMPVDLQQLFADDVFPAVVFEAIDHNASGKITANRFISMRRPRSCQGRG